jgi:hypothetical protein
MLIALATGQLGYAANNWLASSKVAVLAAANFDPQQTLSDSTVHRRCWIAQEFSPSRWEGSDLWPIHPLSRRKA